MIGNFQQSTATKAPMGSIINWHDDISSIPSGWAICDGNNGTPNLLEKTPKCVSTASETPGESGGQNSIFLSESQLPQHDHTGSTGTSGGSHQHDYGMGSGNELGVDNNLDVEINPYNWDSGPSGGNHSHTITDGNTGSGSSINNLPPYREGVYIMKL